MESDGQNLNNRLGNKPCVRQSRTYRQNESGNAMKELMGMGNLCWDTNKLQGVFKGDAYNADSDPVLKKPN